MAEALGIAGGIASLTGLIKQLRNFYDFCRDLKDIPEHVQCTTIETAILRSTLDASSLCFQQPEVEGFDVGEFGLLHLEVSKLLKEAEQIMEICMAKIKAGKGLILRKRMSLLLDQRKIKYQLDVLESVKAS